jgi:predicted dehydrogenase
MGKIKIGILGTANIAKRSVIPAIQELDDLFTLAGVASRTNEKAVKIAEEFNLEVYADYEKLIDSNIIEALYIPLPNSQHYEFAKLALLKGIHVLVEKSLGCSLNEVEELIRLARAKNLLLMENFQFRFHSQFEYLKGQLSSGVIGDLRALNVSFCFPPFPDRDNIRYQKKLGGGALLDAGAYTTKASSLILGNNLSVSAASMNFTDEFDVDIWGGAFLIQEETGNYASLTFGFDHYYQCGVQILGSKGKLSTNRLFTAPVGFSPVIEIELKGKPKQTVKLESDHHFKNMLIHFHKYTNDDLAKERENLSNLEQARLIQAIKQKANV